MKIICTEYEKQVLESIIRNSSPFNQDIVLNGMNEGLYLGGKPVKCEIENNQIEGDKVRIVKGTDLYEAIENVIYEIFDDEIPLNDPTETTEKFIDSVNMKLLEAENE